MRPRIHADAAAKQRAYRVRHGQTKPVGRPPHVPIEYTDEFMDRLNDAHYNSRFARNTRRTLNRRDAAMDHG